MPAPRRMLFAASALALGLSTATSLWAASPQDPSTGGQLNRCWGNIASQTAQLDTPEGTSGGGMGQHSRSTEAADQNGGFANSDNGFGITFNVKEEDETNAGREGVGNVSAQDHDEPGDGGNGLHAINNGSAAGRLDPVDGQGPGEVMTCDVP
jgi:hypothetical protein